MNQINPNEKPSEQEIHYRELKSYFESLVKYTLTALGIVLAAGAFFFFKNISGVRLEANAAIESEKNLASIQLDSIRDQAAKLAVDEAKRRVDDAFKANNVEEMVEKAAKRQVGSTIEHEVAEEVDRYMESIQGDITALGAIADNAMKMRIGLRAGLEQLQNMQTESSSEKIRQRSKVFFESIAADYEAVLKEYRPEGGFKNPKEARLFAGLPDTISNSVLNGKLVQIILTDHNLTQVGQAFLFLRECTGVRFKMFDVKAVEQWCTNHNSECRN